MAFRFKLGQSFADGVRRIGLEQLGIAKAELARSDDPVAGVHEARKALKRTRALLRLARPGLDREAVRHLNERLRDVARILAPSRDRAVLLATVAGLQASAENRARPALAALHEELSGLPRDIPSESAAASTNARGLLDECEATFGSFVLSPDSFEPIGDGLQQTYRRCRKAFALAQSSDSDEAAHNWRKVMQQHWRQLALLQRAWPEEMQARIVAARELSQLLGEANDLAMLASALDDPGFASLPARGRKLIAACCADRKSELYRRAQLNGERLLCERAGAFRRRIEACWQSAVRARNA